MAALYRKLIVNNWVDVIKSVKSDIVRIKIDIFEPPILMTHVFN